MPNEYSLRRSVGEFPSPLRNDRLPYKLDCENWLCYGRPLRSLNGGRQAPLCFPLVCRSFACVRARTPIYLLVPIVSIKRSSSRSHLDLRKPTGFPTMHCLINSQLYATVETDRLTLIVPVAERVDSRR